MSRYSPWLLCVVLLLGSARIASAHFLWLVTESEGTSTKVKVYFGESAAPDDPDLLDRFDKLEAWALSGARNEQQPLSFQKRGDALEAEMPAGVQPSAVILRHNYGVVTKGSEPFLLNYYGKTYPTPLPGTWRPIESKERLPLEISPRVEGTAIVLKVTWQGSAAAGATVTASGPGFDSVEGVTDEQGRFRVESLKAGLYSIRARHIEPTEGEHLGKKYGSVRHYSTLTLHYVPRQLSVESKAFPDLPRGTTSFGGAIVKDSLFVYGGNYGDAHEYSNEGQSGDLWKLDLQKPVKWERLSTGPKLQGLTMVEYRGNLYRVGGFTAMNKAGDEQDLRSQSDFARYDAENQSWETLPGLPEPRSSHDAAVLGDSLYVVGGWNLQGQGQESKWHETAWVINLAAQPLEWKPIAAPPFKRRAVAIAAWQGQLYCLGGMQERGGTTTSVAAYDPAKNAWSEGPRLLGTSMDGFGSSAFACRDQLYATTYSGSIQLLSNSEQPWHYVGQLEHPRFFHRLLPWRDEKLVIVGGGSMQSGKIVQLEIVPILGK